MESTATPCGSTYDPHSALLGGHSMPNTVVLGEGMSEYHLDTPPTLATIAACSLDQATSNAPHFHEGYGGHTLRSEIEAPLITREFLPETYFLSVIMAADAQA